MKSKFQYALKILILLSSISYSNSQCFGKNTNEKPESISEHSENYQQILYERQLEFSLNLFHKLYKKDEKSNLFFSPYSIHQALLLAFFGSSGETELQLRNALELNPNTPKSTILKHYKMENFFMESRAANTTEYEFKLGNKIFFSKDEPLRECVREILDREIEELDFVNNSEGSRDYINNWVYSNTNQKIKNIIPGGVINPKTRLAIANSAYFKGNWEQRFKERNTKTSLFYISGSEVTQTQMMYQKGQFRHGVSEGLRSYIIELPYKGESISMYILLPPFTPNAIEETISRLNGSTLREAIDQNSLYHEKIEIALPKFKIQESFDLKKALNSVGILDLFNPALSNLSDFTSDGNGLSIGTAIHKSFIEVNEEGSEAAASTILIDTRSGRPLDQSRFICNHPFIFIIHDNVSNGILFMGVFKNPKLTEKTT